MRRILAASILLSFLAAGTAYATTPPKQLDKGPGGADYIATTEEVKKEAFGSGAQQVFVFSPMKGADGARPVVVFLHAYGAYNPKIYGAWIDHIVRKGNIVIFPRFQLDSRTPRGETTGHAAAGVRLGMEKAGAAADAGRVAFVGHASGGLIAANLAAGAGGAGIPRPRLVFSLMPGVSKGSARFATPLVDMAAMPADTMLLTLTGESDNIVRDSDARKLIRDAVNVPPPRKMLFKMPTDTHGTPSLFATHIAPMAVHDAYEMDSIAVTATLTPEPAKPVARGRAAAAAAPARSPQPEQLGNVTLDTLDWQGFWKILDVAMPLAFAGQDTTPVKNFPNLTAMGQWSDGWPVKRIAFESAREPKPEDTKPAVPSAIQPKRPLR
ncbi:MAG: chlorophyllase/cutinase-like alpha/beta fold protein [Beijerinckiaceae bacterium]